MVRFVRDNRRTAFTLVELMVAITILSILATIVLFGMSGMQNMAKAQRTKAIIAKIDQLLQERWESYEAVSVDIVDPAIVAYLANPNISDDEKNYWRLGALREKMRYELPERQSDILYPSQLYSGQHTFTGQLPSPLAQYYYYFTQGHAKEVLDPQYPRWGELHQGAECLYMILSRMEFGDASALELFAESEIGDVDGDGMPEILDAWGTPIRIVRWPAAYLSPWHPKDINLNVVGIQMSNEDKISYEDSFDYYQVEQFAPGSPTSFNLRPLIVSAGPDREFGLFLEVVNDSNFVWSHPTRGTIEGITYTNGVRPPGGNAWPGNDPFVSFGTYGPVGSVNNAQQALDNLTNHVISSNVR